MRGDAGRSPQGERGLKSWLAYLLDCMAESLSARRAWIEMSSHPIKYAGLVVALRKESVD